LNIRELTISIIQGLVITAGVLFAYQWVVQQGGSQEKTRAMVFTTLIIANIFLSLTNRSFHYSIFESMKNKNLLFPLISILTLSLLIAILYVPAIANFFQVTQLSLSEIWVSTAIAIVSVLWFELYKLCKRLLKQAL